MLASEAFPCSAGCTSEAVEEDTGDSGGKGCSGSRRGSDCTSRVSGEDRKPTDCIHSAVQGSCSSS